MAVGTLLTARPKKRVFLSFIAENLDRVRGLRLLAKTRIMTWS